MDACVPRASLVPEGAKKKDSTHYSCSHNCCDLPRGFWDANSGPQEEQSVLLIFEPAQIPALVLFILFVALVIEHWPLCPLVKCSPKGFTPGIKLQHMTS